MPVVIIDGEQYVKASEVREMAQRLLTQALSAIEGPGRQLSLPAPPVPPSVPQRPVEPERDPRFEAVISHVRSTSVPTAALLNQKVTRFEWDKDNEVATVKLPKPFVEQFERTPAKRGLLLDAVRAVFGSSADVILLSVPTGTPMIVTEKNADEAVYRAWQMLESQIAENKRTRWTHKDLAAASGLSKSKCYHSFARLRDKRLINTKHLSARKAANNEG